MSATGEVTRNMNKIFSTSDIKMFEKLVETSTNVILTCHVRPDGDAIGSTLGLYHVLRGLGKNATVVVPDQPPKTLNFLPGIREIAVYTRHDPYCQRMVEEADLIICCDFNTMSRQDHLASLIENAECRKILIDHHREPDMEVDLMFSFPSMSSTCELAFRILAAAGLYNEINKESAECLMAGIETDTKNFRVNCSNPEIFEVVTLLMEKGIDRLKIAREAVFRSSVSSLRIKAYAISEKMEIYPSHHCALITLNEDELKKFGYEKGDTEGLVDTPLEVRGIVYSIFLREDTDCVKVSARSISNFPVSEVCKKLYGGGGHLMAAGGEFHGTLEQARQLLISNMNSFDRYLPRHVAKVDCEA